MIDNAHCRDIIVIVTLIVLITIIMLTVTANGTEYYFRTLMLRSFRCRPQDAERNISIEFFFILKILKLSIFVTTIIVMDTKGLTLSVTSLLHCIIIIILYKQRFFKPFLRRREQ